MLCSQLTDFSQVAASLFPTLSSMVAPVGLLLAMDTTTGACKYPAMCYAFTVHCLTDHNSSLLVLAMARMTW